VEREGIVDWARRAEDAGFSTLGTIDRIAYPNFEPLTALSAAAAVTERIGLLTDILISPLRSNTALLAKQAATVDRLSRGRLTLGLAVGGREDDYELSGVPFGERGKIFDRQLNELKAFWGGQGNVGPAPFERERPGILIGGGAPALGRAAEHGDGWTMGGGTPDMFKQSLAELNEAWSSAGREGKPRTVALFYFALGDDAAEVAQNSLGDYYSFLGDYASQIVDSTAKDVDTLRAYKAAFEEAGCDEIVCFPASPDPAQVELLAEAVL
jgi:alkanesulfonate monooxygenase SsuD/methylene tetrahydromethanopterin reductase-like flavin-dependent oxidoreductase (luciferase family)